MGVIDHLSTFFLLKTKNRLHELRLIPFFAALSGSNLRMWSYPGGGWWGHSYYPTWPNTWPNRSVYFHMPAPPAPRRRSADRSEHSSDSMSARDSDEKQASPVEEVQVEPTQPAPMHGDASTGRRRTQGQISEAS